MSSRHLINNLTCSCTHYAGTGTCRHCYLQYAPKGWLLPTVCTGLPDWYEKTGYLMEDVMTAILAILHITGGYLGYLDISSDEVLCVGISGIICISGIMGIIG